MGDEILGLESRFSESETCRVLKAKAPLILS